MKVVVFLEIFKNLKMRPVALLHGRGFCRSLQFVLICDIIICKSFKHEICEKDDGMIYFTKDTIREFKKKFFYLETANGEKALIYKSDKGKAQEALKNEKYTLKFSMYSMLDEKRTGDDVYLLGVNNKQMLMDKILKIFEKEPLNMVYIKIGSDWHILFLSDADTQKEHYKNLNEKQYSWPCVIADEEFSKMLKPRLKPERELLNILNELTKIER